MTGDQAKEAGIRAILALFQQGGPGVFLFGIMAMSAAALWVVHDIGKGWIEIQRAHDASTVAAFSRALDARDDADVKIYDAVGGMRTQLGRVEGRLEELEKYLQPRLEL